MRASLCSDHLCNLYGPTIVHEDKNGKALFDNLNSDLLDDDVNENEKVANGFTKVAQDVAHGAADTANLDEQVTIPSNTILHL
jgi:hypothetical protein